MCANVVNEMMFFKYNEKQVEPLPRQALTAATHSYLHSILEIRSQQESANYRNFRCGYFNLTIEKSVCKKEKKNQINLKICALQLHTKLKIIWNFSFVCLALWKPQRIDLNIKCSVLLLFVACIEQYTYLQYAIEFKRMYLFLYFDKNLFKMFSSSKEKNGISTIRKQKPLVFLQFSFLRRSRGKV